MNKFIVSLTSRRRVRHRLETRPGPEFDASAARSISPPASLTTREREILSHVADGLSTREIADALWVTPATVSKHLERSYRKLGVNGRTAALAALSRTHTT
jgi:DNA-binding CsgD family transcriptional regulator